MVHDTHSNQIVHMERLLPSDCIRSEISALSTPKFDLSSFCLSPAALIITQTIRPASEFCGMPP